MLDFTSALYLGMQHPSSELRPWRQLTTGVPVALSVTPEQHRVETSLARLTNCEAALLGPSTLHLFWDLFGLLAGKDTAILVDRGAYPIARWGVERAQAKGALVEIFPHHDADALELASKRHLGRRIFVITDGFCTGCGARAPVADYLAIVNKTGGSLVLDDTQGLGVLGRDASTTHPLGIGGGGVVGDLTDSERNVIAVSSLAKGFGVPVAVLCGSRDWSKWFIAESDTRVHCSPPSMAHIHAVAHALALNQRRGERIRRRLAGLIQTFRNWLAELNWRTTGDLFPVQTLIFRSKQAAQRLYHRLQRLDIHTVLQRISCSGKAGVSFVLNARHTTRDLEMAVYSLTRATDSSHPYSLEMNHDYSTLGYRMV